MHAILRAENARYFIVKSWRCKRKISDLLQGTKTGKTKIIEVHPDLSGELAEYTKDMENEDWLFPSQIKGRPISREQAFRRLQKAGQECGMPSLSGHVIRKTLLSCLQKRNTNCSSVRTVKSCF